MATLKVMENPRIEFQWSHGPLLDNAAPYGGIGMDELNLIKDFVCPYWIGKIDPLLSAVAGKTNWQYG